MRIIIAGSREFNDYDCLEKYCHEIFHRFALQGLIPSSINESRKVIEIISGHAKGADQLGELFAKKYNLPIKIFLPDWEKFNKYAGFKRNEEMAIYASQDNGILISFWDGESKGTKHMFDMATKYGLKIFINYY